MNSQYDTKKKKPKPLFGLFRTGSGNNTMSNKKSSSPTSPAIPSPSLPTQQPPRLGYDPYEPVHFSRPVEVISSTSTSRKQQQVHPSTRRPRSKSTAATGQRITMSAAQRAHSVKVREQALNKLCGTSPTPSPSTSSPRSPFQQRSPMPRQFTPPGSPSSSPIIRKHVSANDLRQANKHHYDAIYNNNRIPIPSNSTSRTGSPQRTHSPRMIPTTTTTTTTNKTYKKYQQQKPSLPSDDEDSDDDIPLAVTMGTTPTRNNKNFFLLDGAEDDDDKDLIPIATALSMKGNGMLSAADKYKQKVKEQLDMSSDEEDNIPISTMVSSRQSMRSGRQQKKPGLHDYNFCAAGGIIT
ncbi:hypothetical protein INT45_002943 [Circinella minor]|uniref:Uncharacterized protein n=1 Tax=Circinella minor TaxID=1195481 RepID=A0A8H7S7Y6_9FUNG|nr:hypothetical protein INT45_002943 [Circinella minor]